MLASNTSRTNWQEYQIWFNETSIYILQEAQEEAAKYYSEVEKSVVDDHSAVVLVSVSDMKELQEAYPSYLLNAGKFVAALTTFQHPCRVQRYIN